MQIDQRIEARFRDLLQQARALLAEDYSANFELDEHGRPCYGDIPASFTAVQYKWAESSLNLLKRVFGGQSDQYQNFKDAYTVLEENGFTNGIALHKAIGILGSAKDDYENGFAFDLRTRITADLFNDFLERAEYLLGGGDYEAAAVITGCVLEDGLRKLCSRYPAIALSDRPALDFMNGQLAKAGAYNTLTQKKITVLADLRNKAAHGKWNEFEKKDVEKMISEVRDFMERFF